MRTINSPIYKSVIETHHLTIGDFYFFKNLLIAEVKEGIHLDTNNTQTLLKITNSFFKNRPFGHITNRINQYSISPLDIASYSEKLENAVSYCSIIYNNHFDEMNVKIEQHFIKKPYYIANTLEEASFWSKEKVVNTFSISA
ncbi:hypothetical protein [Lacinutrix sp. Bg11-31]|uniref:hypothetical protein n=1 Tax=Lacinutrix sp. Bg11-31 TaxID=2057808 RepID=UPI000C30EF78|nr:hypothetical protein [Lacinutrix sp. Bg11-31]AUC81261.1 hypothetical protein CW733_03570 [Lacinutrix sp. Bg11-31]